MHRCGLIFTSLRYSYCLSLLVCNTLTMTTRTMHSYESEISPCMMFVSSLPGSLRMAARPLAMAELRSHDVQGVFGLKCRVL